MVTVAAILPDGSARPLEDEPVTLPASALVLEIDQLQSESVRLDGRARILPGKRGLVPLDLARSTGYHRLEADGRVFSFATEDAKLRLDGIVAMLADLRSHGLGWGGQLVFSDGALLRDPHVVFGWLDARAPAALDALRGISTQPSWGAVRTSRVERRAGPGVDVSATTRLIRRNPTEHLTERDGGAITIEDKSYDPRVVVRRRRSRSLDTPWNRRALALLAAIHDLSSEVLQSRPGPDAAGRCHDWIAAAERIATTSLFRELGRRSRPGAATRAPATPIEVADHNYRVVFRTSQSLSHGLGWRPRSRPLSSYSYVDYSDEIYQAWTASAIARSLSLEATSPTLGADQPAFVGDNYELYYDTTLPATVLRSWRAMSSVPDRLRPDVVIRDRRDGRVAVIDAKYRSAGSTPTEDSRKEVSSYMASYGLRVAGIAYPPLTLGGPPAVLAGGGNRLVELPMAPGSIPDLLRDEIEAMLSWGWY